jgi:hypothetical protein
MDRATFAFYQAPYGHVETYVKPERQKHRQAINRQKWWIFERPRPELRAATAALPRYIATPQVSKHRLFVWVTPVNLCDVTTLVFARPDDCSFGVLQSHLHEVWALKLGTRLETRPRYTPTTCFETFPFPWAPGTEPKDDPQVQAIATAAKELCALRDRWLNPPEWTQEEVLEFPATVGGIWDRFIGGTAYAAAESPASELREPPPSTPWGKIQQQQLFAELKREFEPPRPPVGSVALARYPRRVARDADSAAKLAKRTLTNLYNQRPEWLSLAHRKLDEAVCSAYGWPADLSDDAILEKLLALNLERAGG